MPLETLKPFDLEILANKEVRLTPKAAFRLFPYYDQQLALYVVDDPVLGVLATSTQKENLEDKATEAILHLWMTYVKVSDSHLSQDALALKFNLLQMFREIQK